MIENHLPLDALFGNAGSQMSHLFSCPTHVQWNDAGLERDLYIQTTSITVLAMDGRRRWLDIQRLVSFICGVNFLTTT